LVLRSGPLFARSYNATMSEGLAKLIDVRALDGSRQFAAIPDHGDWNALQHRLAASPGVVITAFISDGVTQAITDFTYGGHQFTVDTQFGELWLFVSDPDCPEQLLVDIVTLFAKIRD
jgi:hypothetical protein